MVLRGRPTLREPAGERALEEGDVVHFAVGPEGAHQLLNRTAEPVRYLMVSNRPSPEAVEYPDTRQISVMAFTESQLGRPLWDMRTRSRLTSERSSERRLAAVCGSRAFASARTDQHASPTPIVGADEVTSARDGEGELRSSDVGQPAGEQPAHRRKTHEREEVEADHPPA